MFIAPVTDIRVIDFGHYLAGPLVGMLLADQGAEVIKIDWPGNTSLASPLAALLNRGKQCLEIDLKTDAGAKQARDLVAGADVLIENFRPGVMKRLGLGPDEMTELNPRLVYLSLPGFFSTEGDAASIRAFEGVISAATGLFTDLHWIRRQMEAPPVYTPLPLPSAYAAIHGALAVTLGLYAREEHGAGDVIEVPLAGATMSAMGGFVLDMNDPPYRFPGRGNPADHPLSEEIRDADDSEQLRIVESLRSTVPPAFESYELADGRWGFILCHGNARHGVQVLKALGIYDGLLADGMVDEPMWTDLRRGNCVQQLDRLSDVWRAEVRKRMAVAFASQPADYWYERMREFGVPYSVHRTTQEWLRTEGTEAAGFSVVVEDPRHGPIRQMGIQTSLARTVANRVQPRPAGTGDVEALLRESQTRPSDMSRTTNGAHPAESGYHILAGIKVLDLSTVLAGPCCAKILAEYGADVVKIDSPQPYFSEWTTNIAHMEVSQGKRSLILDLKQEEGKRVFDQLARAADVIVHNMRPGTAERLGIDYEAVSAMNPDIVYTNVTAFQGPRRGPWNDLPGFDPVLQAATGVQTRYGGEGRRPELHGFAASIDYLTGYSGAYGIALALLQRQRRGGGDLVFTSLAQGGQLLQAPFMWATETVRPNSESQGQNAKGESSVWRLYRASDGWLFLAGLVSEVANLRQVAELAGVPIEPEAEKQRVAALSAAIRERPVAHWVVALQAAGFGCHRVDRIEEIRRAGTVHEVTSDDRSGGLDDGAVSIARVTDHPSGTAVDVPAPTFARFRRAALQLATPCPKIGSNSREILVELGHSNDEVDRWVASGVVREQFRDEYIPR